MKKRQFAYTVLSGLLIMMALISTIFTTTPRVDAQQPTATPDDPIWLAFDAVRTALEEKLQREIKYVKSYTWEEAEFTDGLAGCKTYGEDEPVPETVYFGWRFILTLLDNTMYEIRTSFNRKIIVICDTVTVATTASNSSLPVSNPVGPGALEIGGQVTGLYDDALKAMSDAGMTWVKFQAHHGVPYEHVVAFIGEAHSKNLRVLVSAVGERDTIMDPTRQDDFAKFVGKLAKEGADAIEVWNEPNIDREWPNGHVSGANYAGLLIKSYNAIKAQNPNTLVISAAPAPTGYFGTAGCTAQGCNDDVFYQQMAEAGAANYLDCVGAHYNEGVVGPLQNSGDPRDNYPTRYYSTNLNRALANFPGRQACFTELGYLSPEGYGSLPAGFEWGGNTSIAEQAEWLGQVVSQAKAAGNVRLIIIFNVNFYDTPFTTDPMAGYAIIRRDGSCPACSTIRAALSN